MDRFFFVLYNVRYDSHSGGEREIQRTMLELLNQLDGFDSKGDVKVNSMIHVPQLCNIPVDRFYPLRRTNIHTIVFWLSQIQ